MSLHFAVKISVHIYGECKLVPFSAFQSISKCLFLCLYCACYVSVMRYLGLDMVCISLSIFWISKNFSLSFLFESVCMWFRSVVQVILCQKHSFLDQLTQNMTTDCLLHYNFSTRKLQVQYMLSISNCSDCQNKNNVIYTILDNI